MTAYLPVAEWWDRASEQDQTAVLLNLHVSGGFAGVPWAFLPPDLQHLLQRRIRIDASRVRLPPKPPPSDP